MYFAGGKNDYELQLLRSSVCAMDPFFFMDVSGKSQRETLNRVCVGVCVTVRMNENPYVLGMSVQSECQSKYYDCYFSF